MKYDPIRILIKQNSNEKDAYNAGFDAGKEKGDEELQKLLALLVDRIVNRILDVEDITADTKIHTVFMNRTEPHHAYMDGLRDALKFIEKLAA